jgi:hypothetical protein
MLMIGTINKRYRSSDPQITIRINKTIALKAVYNKNRQLKLSTLVAFSTTNRPHRCSIISIVIAIVA